MFFRHASPFARVSCRASDHYSKGSQMDKPFLVIVSLDDGTFARVYEVPSALFGEDFDEDHLAPFRKRELEECSWCLEASDYSRVFLFTVLMP